MNVYSYFNIPAFGLHVTVSSDENSSKISIGISTYGLRIVYRNSWPFAEVNFPKDTEIGNTVALRGTEGIGEKWDPRNIRQGK
jgi:hypothetical protein